jgi:hypothetical protein
MEAEEKAAAAAKAEEEKKRAESTKATEDKVCVDGGLEMLLAVVGGSSANLGACQSRCPAYFGRCPPSPAS